MDLKRTVYELRLEKEKLDRIIAALEDLESSSDSTESGSPSRRGRKSMGAAERRDVSTRMKRYWAQRKKALAAS